MHPLSMNNQVLKSSMLAIKFRGKGTNQMYLSLILSFIQNNKSAHFTNFQIHDGRLNFYFSNHQNCHSFGFPKHSFCRKRETATPTNKGGQNSDNLIFGKKPLF